MKRVVTEKDLELNTKNGTFVVERDMMLTPSARELALRSGIKLEYSNEKTTAKPPAANGDIAKLIEDLVVREILAARGAPAPATLAGVPESRDTANNSARAVAPPAQHSSNTPLTMSKIDTNAMNSVVAEVLNCSTKAESSVGRAIVTVVGQNRPGVVARISTAVFEAGGDLADMNQVVVGEFFSLILVVNLAGMESKGISFRVFKEKLLEEEARLGCVKILVMHEGIFGAMHKV